MEFKLLKRKCGLTCAFRARQFRFASQYARLHYASLRFSRRLHGQQDIVKSNRQEIQEHAGRKQERVIARQSAVDPVKIVQAGEHSAQNPGREKPQAARDQRAGHVRKQKARQRGSFQRGGLARIPRGEAYE